MSLFKTGFSVDASVPVPSTSTTAHPGAGSTAHKKRKRSNSNSKVEETVPLQVNGNAPAIRPQQQPTASPAVGSPSANAKQQSNGTTNAVIQQASSTLISDMMISSENKIKQQQENQETVVNIEKLMKKLQRMEKGEKAEKNASSGNGDASNKKKQKLSVGATTATSTQDSTRNKGKGKDIGGSASAATAEGGETTSSTNNNNNKKNKNKKTKAGKSDAPKVDYVPDEAALAKREERKRKREAQKASSSTTAAAAAASSAGTVEEEGGHKEVVEGDKDADESNMHIDLLEVESLPVAKTDTQESKPSKKKKGKKDDGKEPTEQEDMNVDADVPTSTVEEAVTAKDKKQKKKKGTERTEKTEVASSPIKETVQTVKESKTKSKQQQPSTAAIEKSVQSMPSATTSSNVPASDSGMTELQKKMQKKLGGARFRWINEQLYTTSGVDALQLMEEDPAMFEDYHNGFASQAASWPSQPIQLFIDFFRSSSSSSATSSSASPKPVIADLGCGKAELAATLVPLGYTVLSYDLVESEPYIIKAQCTKRLPLPGSSSNMEEKDDSIGAVVDYVVCCLSLMGSDWLGMIREARRVLKSGGKLKIAEVTSRFEDVKAFINLITAMGFKLLKKDDSNTHFILFDFEKVPMSSCKSPLLNLSSEAKIEKSQELLKPCIYKRR